MREESIKEFVDFIRQTECFDLIHKLTVFRGQPLKGELVPSIARNNPGSNTTEQEKQLLQKLRLMGASLIPVGSNDLELLVRARHFGLKTRLLDWTSNPLAALWFACADHTKPRDVFVYALAADTMLKEDVYDKDPFTSSETRVFQPRLDNPRLIAQHAWFTLHGYSLEAKRFVPLEVDPETKNNLTEIHIPAESREDILRSLERLGISSRTLFPDLQGLCQYLNWEFGLAGPYIEGTTSC